MSGVIRAPPSTRTGSGQRSQGAKWQAADCAGRDLAQRRRPPRTPRRRRGSAGGTSSPPAPRPGRAGRRGSAWRARALPPITGSDSSRRFVYGCCGRVEDRVDRPGLDDPAGVHDRDPVARLGQHREVVADQDQRQPELGAQALEQLEDLRLHHDVERRRRLVGDHQRRPARERQRDHHPLALAAGELVRVGALDPRRQADGAEQLGDPRRARRPTSPSARAGGSPTRSGCRRA